MIKIKPIKTDDINTERVLSINYINKKGKKVSLRCNTDSINSTGQ
jgi:hypothetical protein